MKMSYYLKRIHFYSGIFLSVFIAIHLFNHLLVLSGPETHIRFMKAFRKVYRNPFIESILLLCVGLQIVSGVSNLFAARYRGQHIFIILKSISGIALGLFLLNHVYAVLSARYSKVETDVYFGAWGLNHFPQVYYFLPYYSFAVIFFFIHIASIHYLKGQSRFAENKLRLQARSIIFIGMVISFLIMAGMTSWFTWKL